MADESLPPPTPKRATRAKKSAAKEKESSHDAGNADLLASLGTQLLGGTPRQTLPVNANVLGALPWAYLPRRQYESLDLTTISPGAFSPQQLLEVLCDADPNVSLALWNFQRLAAAGFEYEVRTPDNTAEDPDGKAILDEIVGRLNDNWGGMAALVNQWIMSVVLEGACAGECVPNADITDVADFATVAPWTVYFQRDIDQALIAYQWQPMLASGSAYANNMVAPNPSDKAPAASEILLMQALNHGGFRQLNEITFGYVPLDAMIDDPYGRMPFASILQIIVFDAQLLKDLRQWSHVNAFGRIDITVVADMVQGLMPPAVASDAQKRINWLTQFLGNIQHAYNSLNPDDTFVHFDSVKVGASDSSGKTFDITSLVVIIEDRIFRALKQLPILMGSNRGTTETWGTLQMEVYALGIANIQHTVASLLDKLLTAALRIRGRVSVVHSSFAQLRASDRSKSAVAESIEIKNAAAKRDQGWITQDEAAIEITKSPSVADAPNPDPQVALGQPDAGARPADAPAPEAQNDGDNPDESDEGASNPKDKADAKPGKSDKKGPNGATKGANVGKNARLLGTDRANDSQSFSGVMVAFFLAPKDAKKLAIPDGEAAADLHMTLAFLGDSSIMDDDQVALLKDKVGGFAKDATIITGTISGIGRFTSVPEGEKTPIYASVDAPLLPDFRQSLVDAIQESYLVVNAEHGFTPHITLAYIDADAPMPVEDVPALNLTFDTLCLAIGDDRILYPLKEPNRMRVSPAERSAIEHAMVDLTRKQSDTKHAYRGPSATRQQHESELKTALAKHFRRQRVSATLIDHIITAHTARNQDNMALGLDRLAAAWERADATDDLTPAQRDALIASIAASLADEIPDDDGDFTDLLSTARIAAWNAGGQEALDRVNLSGTFNLTNADLLTALNARVQTRAAGMQQTTRNLVAGAIVTALLAGLNDSEVQSAIDDAFASMADGRADGIAFTETADAWMQAAQSTWGQNGVAFKVWVTSGDPDPHAGASGETPCRDNEYAGAIAMDDSFPSGDDCPPAHPECVCELDFAGDPSEAAQAEPWTGGD